MSDVNVVAEKANLGAMTPEECLGTKCPSCSAKPGKKCRSAAIPGQWHSVRVERALTKRKMLLINTSEVAA